VQRGGSRADFPLLTYYNAEPKLELIPPVQIAVDPLATSTDSAWRAARTASKVLLYGSREVGSVVPQ
jgi:hypothetical protein